MALSRRALTAVLTCEAVAMLLTAATVADLQAHWRGIEQRAVNMWGFRGPTHLDATGRRVALVGGSAAYGYGVDAVKAMPNYLGFYLDRLSLTGPRRVSIDLLNLAAAGDGPLSYVNTLRAYEYLKPDTLVIYDGYAGAGLTGDGGARHRSLVFRATGYFPILRDAAAGRETLAPADLAVVDPLLRADGRGDVTCDGGSRAYCAAIAETVAWAVARGILAVVVTPPYVSQRHELQQASLAALLQARFRDNARFRYINMGRLVDLADRRISFDGIHLTALGNQTVGDELSRVLLPAMEGR